MMGKFTCSQIQIACEKGLDLPFLDDNDKKIADYKEKAGLGTLPERSFN